MREEIFTQLSPFVPEYTAVPPAFTARMLGIGKNERFIDVGCGNGEHTFFASSLSEGGCSVGVDSERFIIEHANTIKSDRAELSMLFRRWPEIDAGYVYPASKRAEFQRAYAEELSRIFNEGYFNKALLSRVLRWTASAEDSLEEVYKILACGGKVLLVDTINYVKDIRSSGFNLISQGDVPNLPDCYYLLEKP